jgi:hypothetical protein
MAGSRWLAGSAFSSIYSGGSWWWDRSNPLQGSRPAWFPREFGWVVGCTYKGMPEGTAPVRNLIGANMSFRRTAFSSAGLFTEGLGRTSHLPEGCEETELSIRVKRVLPQSELIYQPAARVTHLVPASRARWEYYLKRSFSEGVSKAKVARLAGVKQGLSSEWTYTLKVLPNGFIEGLADALKGDLSGLGRGGSHPGWIKCHCRVFVGTIANRFTPASQSSEGSLRNDLRRRSVNCWQVLPGE